MLRWTYLFDGRAGVGLTKKRSILMYFGRRLGADGVVDPKGRLIDSFVDSRNALWLEGLQRDVPSTVCECFSVRIDLGARLKFFGWLHGCRDHALVMWCWLIRCSKV